MSEHPICVSAEDVDLLGIKVGPSSGYARTTTRPQVYIHHIIAKRCGLVWNRKTEVIDHINRNKLDNRRENLRVVSRSQNATNSVRSEKSKGYYKNKRLWIARFVKNGVNYRASFGTEIDAQNYVREIKKKTT